MYFFNETILKFWIWWYQDQLQIVLEKLFRILTRAAYNSGFITHASNIFVPLYQQHSLIGRVVSLLIRIIIIVFSLGIVLPAGLLIGLIAIAYIILPIYLPLKIIFLVVNQ